MFKIFPGYDLVESYHNWKKNHKVDSKTVSRAIRLLIAIGVALVVWCLPVENWIDGMTIPVWITGTWWRSSITKTWRISSPGTMCSKCGAFPRKHPGATRKQPMKTAVTCSLAKRPKVFRKIFWKRILMPVSASPCAPMPGV